MRSGSIRRRDSRLHRGSGRPSAGTAYHPGVHGALAMGCLALNASYEPLTLVPPRRAVRLVLDRKAEILEVDVARRFRSERDDLPSPTVIRLVRFVHVPRRLRRQVTNTFLFARDDYRCQYCGAHRRELRGRQFLTRDHVIPLSQGGGNAWGNVVTACSPCNHRKANRTPEQARMPLIAEPGEPNHVHLVWAVRRVTASQARWIATFYGDDTLAVLRGEREEGPDPQSVQSSSQA